MALIKNLILIILVLFISGCNDPALTTSKGENSILLYKNVNIDYLTNENTIRTFKIIDGTKNVYILKIDSQYFNNFEYDIKSEEYILFKSDVNDSSVNFCNSELSKINCIYFFVGYEKQLLKKHAKIIDGCITSEKDKHGNNYININVNVPNFSNNGLFSKKNKQIRGLYPVKLIRNQ